MINKIKDILERAEPCPDRISKSDRIVFYQKQLRDIGDIVGVPEVATKKSVKKKKKIRSDDD